MGGKEGGRTRRFSCCCETCSFPPRPPFWLVPRKCADGRGKAFADPPGRWFPRTVGVGPLRARCWRVRTRLCRAARGRQGPPRAVSLLTKRQRHCVRRARGCAPRGRLHSSSLLVGGGAEVCSHGAPARARAHPRPLAAATPASPGSSPKLFTAAIVGQGESNSASGCSSRDGAEGTGRRPSRSARGTSADLPETPPPLAYCWETDGEPRAAWGRPSLPRPHPRAFLSPTLRSLGRNEAI